jgi:hypothetical protein
MNRLQLACQTNNIARVLQLINEEEDINRLSTVNSLNRVKLQAAAKPPLYIALEKEHRLLASILILCGANKQAVCDKFSLAPIRSNDLLILLLTAITKDYSRVVSLAMEYVHAQGPSAEIWHFVTQIKPHLLAFMAAHKRFSMLQHATFSLLHSEGPLCVLGRRSVLYWALRYEASASVIDALLKAGESTSADLQTLYFLQMDGLRAKFADFYQRLSKTDDNPLQKLERFVTLQASSSVTDLSLQIISDPLLAARRQDAFLLKEHLRSTDEYAIFETAFKQQDYVAVGQILALLPNKKNLLRLAIDYDQWNMVDLIAFNEPDMYAIEVFLLDQYPETFQKFSRANNNLKLFLQAIFFREDTAVLDKLLNFLVSASESKEEKQSCSLNRFEHLKPEEKILVTNALLDFIEDTQHVDLQLLRSPLSFLSLSEKSLYPGEGKEEMERGALIKSDVVSLPSLNERLEACRHIGRNLDLVALHYLYSTCEKWHIPFDKRFLPPSRKDITSSVPDDLWMTQKENEKEKNVNITTFLSSIDRASLACVSRRFSRLSQSRFSEQSEILHQIDTYIKQMQTVAYPATVRPALTLVLEMLLFVGATFGYGVLIKTGIDFKKRYSSLFAEAEKQSGDATHNCVQIYQPYPDEEVYKFCRSSFTNISSICLYLAGQMCDTQQKGKDCIDITIAVGMLIGPLLLWGLHAIVRNLYNIYKQHSSGEEAALAQLTLAHLPVQQRDAILSMAERNNLSLITRTAPLNVVRNELKSLGDRLRHNSVRPLQIRTDLVAREGTLATPVLSSPRPI